jgi:hypothetical protein
MHDTGPQEHRPSCADIIPPADWGVYLTAIHAMEEAGVSFAVGGGMAYGCYVSRPRYTKDLDLFVLPSDRERAVDAIQRVQFADYHDVQAYQRHWIFRGHHDGLILDLIWQMANSRAEVDEGWLARGPVTLLHETPVRLVPVEEMIWGKLYVMQRERSDWPDVFNLFVSHGATLDWPRLVERMGHDRALLGAAVQLFGWLSPRDAHAFPGTVWSLLEIPRPSGTGSAEEHAPLLDSREWFCRGTH